MCKYICEHARTFMLTPKEKGVQNKGPNTLPEEVIATLKT